MLSINRFRRRMFSGIRLRLISVAILFFAIFFYKIVNNIFTISFARVKHSSLGNMVMKIAQSQFFGGVVFFIFNIALCVCHKQFHLVLKTIKTINTIFGKAPLHIRETCCAELFFLHGYCYDK